MTGLTLVPYAGMCNRMNTILCGIAVHRTYHIPVAIHWEKTADCHANYTELFEPMQIDGITISPLRDFCLKPGGKKCLYLPNLLRRFKFDLSYDDHLKITEKDFSEIAANKKNIYICAYNEFCLSRIERSVADYFQPIKLIQDRIDAKIAEFAPKTIGIHIRRTDNTAAIRNNPIEKYINHIKTELREDPVCKFYLATDSEEVKRFLIDRYPNKIITSELSLTRSSTEGMQDALVELFCLSHTNKLIGSTNSTFTFLASRLYNIPLTL